MMILPPGYAADHRWSQQGPPPQQLQQQQQQQQQIHPMPPPYSLSVAPLPQPPPPPPPPSSYSAVPLYSPPPPSGGCYAAQSVPPVRARHVPQSAPQSSSSSSSGFLTRLGSSFSSLFPFPLPFVSQPATPQRPPPSPPPQPSSAHSSSTARSDAHYSRNTLAVPSSHGNRHERHADQRERERNRERVSASRSTSASSMHSSAYSISSRDSRRHAARGGHGQHHAPHHAPHSHRHHHHRAGRTPSVSIRSGATEGDRAAASPSDQEGLIKVKPGDLLHHGRFKVLGVAGQGTFGTVLDVYDLKHHQRLALKVVRSVSRYLEAAAIEIDILDKIRTADVHKRSLCVRLYRDFELTHAGQRHVCIATEKLGRSLYEFIKRNRYRGFQLSAVRVLGYQLIQAVAFCHSIGLIHTDLKPENILLAHSEYSVVAHAGHSDYRVPRSLEIRLIDFGGATFEHEHHSRIVNTRQYRAPEVLLGLGWSFPSDMWSVGCILCELLTGELLFATHEDLEHLAMMEKVLEEEIPRDMGERAIRPWRKKRAEEMDELERERARERDRTRRLAARPTSRDGRRVDDRRDDRNGKRARSPYRDAHNKRSRHEEAERDHGPSLRARPSTSSSSSRYRYHHPHASPALSPSRSRDRSASHARVNHLLSLSTARLRWPPSHPSSTSLKHVRRAPTLRSLLLPVDPDLFDLVRRCLQWDGTRRIKAEDALMHPLFRGVKEDIERRREEERKRGDSRRQARYDERPDGRSDGTPFRVQVEYAEEKGERHSRRRERDSRDRDGHYHTTHTSDRRR